jgi:hypothetical protein
MTSRLSGWGTGIYDFNNDGWKDIFVANGDVQDNAELISDRKSRQQNLLLLNDGKNGFNGQLFGLPSQYRGAAFGDFDRDGRIDVVVTRLNEPPVLLRNIASASNHWLAVKLVGHASNRDGIGARITFKSSGGIQINHVSTAVGYASSSDAVVHFGLGSSSAIDSLTIEWPSGLSQRVAHPAIDTYLVVQEPTGPA